MASRATRQHPQWALRRRRLRSALLVVVTALVGAWLALLVAGTVPVEVGPVRTQATVRPSWTGDTVIDVPPLGQLRLDSHDGPLAVSVEVTGLDPRQAEAIFRDPRRLAGLEDRIVADARAGLAALAARTVVVSLVGSALVTLVVVRRPRRLLARAGAGAGVTAAVLAVTAGVGAATYNPASIGTPTYSGLLANTPTLVGDAQNIVTNFSAYRGQLAKLVTNVSRLYDTTLNLPTYTPAPDTVRLLVVSDVHLNPAAWDVIRSTVNQFQVHAVIDAGDIADHGFPAENQLVVPEIAALDVPYVYVRGNHDSVATAEAIDALPNAVALDATTTMVEGVRILGVSDPRFTPDKETRNSPPPASVPDVGHALGAQAWALAQAGTPVDVAVMHDPHGARMVDGTTPLVLAGHVHRRYDEVLPRGTRLFVEGSTGGSGLRALERERPTRVTLSVLYLDRTTHRVQAWDDIVLGGLGESSVTITRHQAPADELGPFVPVRPGAPPPPRASPTSSAVPTLGPTAVPTAIRPLTSRPARSG